MFIVKVYSIIFEFKIKMYDRYTILLCIDLILD